MKGSGTRRQTFAGLLKQRQADLHLTAKKAMQMMGMPPTTYRRKVLNPESITVLELAAFRRVYGLTDEDIAGLLDRRYI
jgi:hypothetical protein